MNKKLLLTTITVLCFCIPVEGQILDGYDMDSSYVTFDTTDIADLHTDSVTIWQIGGTTKNFFASGTTPVRSIMTDTLNYYPVNANSWFEIRFNNWGLLNTIVDFKHKYQTDPLHDGCIVEFSTDNGATWENVKGDCNGDGSMGWSTVHTDNFYTNTDTLITGEMAFNGTSAGWITSRVQFFLGYPIKSTDSTSWCNINADTIYLRFRFLSDSTADSLDGWIIDSIMIENDYYPGSVAARNKTNQLSIHPNPAYNEIINFPYLPSEKTYTTEIINNLGQTIYRHPYSHQVDLRQYPAGLYFYRVSNNTETYNGKILLE